MQLSTMICSESYSSPRSVCLKEFGLDKASGLFAFPGWYTIKNCQILVKNLNFVAGMTRRFVSAKKLIQYFSNSSTLVEHRAQVPLTSRIKMLAVWPSIAEGFPTACSRIIYNKKCQILVKNLNFAAGMTRRFVSAKRLIRYFSNSS